LVKEKGAINQMEEIIRLAHGNGGKLAQELIKNVFSLTLTTSSLPLWMILQ